MTIDERLDRLTERHEALTQTVELMAIENRERDKRWDTRHAQLVEIVEKLLHIAEIHEQRLDRLESK